MQPVTWWWQGPEYEAFIDAAKLEEGTEFVQTMDSEVAQMFIKPPFVALRKQEPEQFSAFGKAPCWPSSVSLDMDTLPSSACIPLHTWLLTASLIEKLGSQSVHQSDSPAV